MPSQTTLMPKLSVIFEGKVKCILRGFQNTKPVQRNTLDSGEGKTCLRDYRGINDAKAVVKQSRNKTLNTTKLAKWYALIHTFHSSEYNALTFLIKRHSLADWIRKQNYLFAVYSKHTSLTKINTVLG